MPVGVVPDRDRAEEPPLEAVLKPVTTPLPELVT